MFLTLHIPWIMIDTAGPNFRPILVPPGQYHIDRVPNPQQTDNQCWIVIRGTQVGLSEQVAREMEKCSFGGLQLSQQTPEPEIADVLQ